MQQTEMPATQTRAEMIMQRLAEQGYRLTSTRAAIAQAIAAATVFRALDLLVQMGLLERLHGDLSCHSYTYCAPEHHHHLICTTCGQVTSVVAGNIERELRNLARQANFRAQGHHIEVYGQCQACQGRD
jgi:Fur family ferric uptake transcriptional regulator